MRGDSPPSREAGQSVANCLTDRADRGGTNSEGQRLIPQVANPLTARMGKGVNTTADEGQTPIVTHSLRAEGFDASEDGTGMGTPLVPCVAPTLRAGGNRTGGDRPPGTDVDTCESLVPVAFDTTQITSAANYSNPKAGDPCHPLAAGAHPPAVANAMQVRRLTPRECERLQGFPDDYTLVLVRGKPAADGPRYKALGNSMAVPVMRWIGERVQMVEELTEVQKVAA